MSKIKRPRPSRLLLYFAIFASLINCVFIVAVIFSHRNQNRKFSQLLSKVYAREAPSSLDRLRSPVPVGSSTNVFTPPTFSRLEQLSPSPSPYAVVRKPRPGSDLSQVITHEGEMRWVRYSELPPAWRISKKHPDK